MARDALAETRRLADVKDVLIATQKAVHPRSVRQRTAAFELERIDAPRSTSRARRVGEPAREIAPGVDAGFGEQRKDRAPDERARLDVTGAAANEIGRVSEEAGERADVTARQIGKKARADRMQAERIERKGRAGPEPFVKIAKKRQLEASVVDDRRGERG